MDRTHDMITVHVALPGGATWQGPVDPREFCGIGRWVAPGAVRGLDDDAVRRVLGGWVQALLPGLVVSPAWGWRDLVAVIDGAIDAVEEAVS